MNYLFVQIVPVHTAYAEEIPIPRVSVVINEVMWMGSDLSTADEWVELAAFSDDPTLAATLSGWTLVSVKDGAEQTIMRFGSGTTLSAGAFAVIGNYAEPQSRLAVHPIAVSAGMSLPNTKLLLRLYDDTRVLRDEADDGVGNPFAGTNTSTTKASMERIDLRVPGNIASNWRASSLSLGFDPVPFALFGTPGYAAGPAASFSSPSSASSISSLSSAFSTSSSSSSSSDSSSSASYVASPVPLLRINELMPDPVGSDDGEWIEILNVGSGSLSTAGITLSMSGGTAHALPITELMPGIPLLLSKTDSKLSLTNAGGVVVLRQGGAVIDALSYPSVPEGIAFGRGTDGLPKALCATTPGLANSASGSTVAIDVQSGMPTGESVTLNLALRAVAGSAEGGSCRWEYPDGYLNESCNPPSHALQSFGAGEITLTFTDYCGNTMKQSLPVFVSRKPKKIEEEDAPWALGFSCMPSAFTGATVTELLPNPDGDEAQGEWIELRNDSGRDLPLCGWALEDAKGTRFDLSHLRLPLDETLVFPRSRTDIVLNNDADAVRLLAPDSFGGSGAVVQEVSFKNAPGNQAYALRADGHWLWTPLATPGTPNAFADVPLPVGAAKARIAAVLPNPEGKDAVSEWIEIENLTGRPLWMQGWTVWAGKGAPLSGNAIHPYATVRLPASDLGLTLRNATGAVRLYDERGVEMEPLTWNHPKEGEIVRRPMGGHAKEGVVEAVTEAGDFVIRFADNTSLSTLLPSLDFHSNKKCLDLISALIINKKVELLFDTDLEEPRIVVEGYDIASFILKGGCATVSHKDGNGLALGYGLFEKNGYDQRRGIWANDAEAIAIRKAQSDDDVLRRITEDGFVVESSLPEGLVDSGSTVSLSSDIPGRLYLSLNGEPYRLYETGAVLTSDSFLQAYAEIAVGTGTVIRSDVIGREYVLRRASYERIPLLSEIYPSPRKGEEEWVELFNPTSSPVNLTGWLIDDVSGSGSKPFALSTDDVIPPDSFFLLKNLKVSWNNGGDDVRLIAPDGTVIDSVRYPKLKTGTAFVRTEVDRWSLTERSTPYSLNEIFFAPKKSKNSRSALTKNKKSNSNKRKILYKNIVQIGQGIVALPSLFASLSSLQWRPGTAVIGSRSILFTLLIAYLVFIACFWRFRRH